MKRMLSSELLGLWENAVIEIRNEIKAQESPALVYAKELCDKLEESMVNYAKGEDDKAVFEIGG